MDKLFEVIRRIDREAVPPSRFRRELSEIGLCLAIEMSSLPLT
jgi:hypothetical protein